MRKDYLEERFSLVVESNGMALRHNKNPYAPGNEQMTKLSVLSLVARGNMLQRLQDTEEKCVSGWSVRVFESDNPLVLYGKGGRYGDRPHYEEPAFGYHYVVVASPERNKSLSSIDSSQWFNILLVIQDRLQWLYSKKGVAYVAVYANHGATTGSHNTVPHLNMVTFPMIPPVIAEEGRMTAKTVNEKGECPMCQIVEAETDSPRQILKNDEFIAFCPWSPRSPYEFWIVPKKHSVRFPRVSQKDLHDLAQLLRATLGGLSKLTDDMVYGMAFHLSPETKNTRQIHWHVEVYPEAGAPSGLEKGYGIFVNDLSPEKAAEKLGALCRRELATMVGIS